MKLSKKILITIVLFLFVCSYSHGLSEESSSKQSNNPKNVFTPEDQLEYIKSGRLVLTNEDRSNPLDPKYFSTYHNMTSILERNLFFKKKIYTGENTTQIEVEYQAVYLTSPLQGFLPWPSVRYESPPAGNHTADGPDHVMESSPIWVMGIIVNPKNSMGYPEFVDRQSPWFKLADTKLYKKSSVIPDSPVGAIISSILSPKEFLNEEMKKYWVEADGRDVQEHWAYAKLPSNPKSIPDLRGMFLRGLNKFSKIKGQRTDKWKDQGSRSTNGYQKDEIRDHSHTVPHFAPTSSTRANIAALDVRSNAKYATSGYSMANGGKETRPKNIGVYYYIRIN